MGCYRKILFWLGLLPLLALSACANDVIVDVTRFHQLAPTSEQSPKVTSEPIHFQFKPEALHNGDLEFAAYSKEIEAALFKAGFVNAKPATFEVDFQVSSSKNIIHSMDTINTPFVYCSGVSPNLFCGTSYWQSMGAGATYQVYRNTLEIEFLDPKSHQRLWQARAESETLNLPQMQTLIPYLARAALEGFPGQSGKTIEIRIELSPKK